VIYKGNPIKILSRSGVSLRTTYRFKVNLEGDITVLKNGDKEVILEGEHFEKLKDLEFFKLERGMQGEWEYIVKTNKEEADEAEEIYVKEEKKKKERKEKKEKIEGEKKEAKQFDDLLSSI
jgi:hypothetical protein